MTKYRLEHRVIVSEVWEVEADSPEDAKEFVFERGHSSTGRTAKRAWSK